MVLLASSDRSSTHCWSNVDTETG